MDTASKQRIIIFTRWRLVAIPAEAAAMVGRNLLIVLVIGSLMLYLAWVGYVGTDDFSYVQGSLGWLNDFPYVGKNHWTLRHTVVIPVAISFVIFGMREISLGLPSAVMFLFILGFNYIYLLRFFGAPVALLASTLLATTPLFVVQATFSQDVIVQLLAVSLSFWLFYSATQNQRSAWLLGAAGVAAAFGWLTLETTAALLLFYAILFLIGFGVPRKYYWIMALGFVLIVGAEIGYFVVMTGDPLYRYRIDLFHDTVDRVGDVAATLRAGRILDLEGNLAVSPFLEPFTALLINQEFGLLFWAYIPAAVWAWKTKRIATEDQRLLKLLIGFGIVWMAFISLNTLVLYVVPRYYAPFTWSAVIIVAYWLKWFLRAQFPGLGRLATVALLSINLLCVYVENKNPLFAERALVEYVSRHPGVVYTDPMTLGRAWVLLRFRQNHDRVSSQFPPPGAVFYSNIKNIERCRLNGSKCNWSWKQYIPKDTWHELARVESDRKWSGILLRWFGIDRYIPEEIFGRLDRPNPGGIFYLTSRRSL